MTKEREEKIRQYLKERNIPIDSLEANSIIEGINWADKHPKEGFISIDKACNWLEDNLFDHAQDAEELEIEWDPSITTNLIVCDYFNSIDDCINDFRKAMEE